MSSPVYVNAESLASYLSTPLTDAIQQIADRTNDLIDEEWTARPDPEPTVPPARVVNIAYNAAVRAAANPKGLTSWTRSWDDITRTERVEGARQMGLYLTPEERLELNGSPTNLRRARSIQLGVPRLGI